MIQVNQIKLPISHSKQELEDKIRKLLRLDKNRPFTYCIEKRSLDARKKPNLSYVYSCLVEIAGEQTIIKKANSPSVFLAKDKTYQMPKHGEEEYLYDDKALERYRKRQTGPFTLQRYKGLGEMDADQLWETTLNPATRVMKRVEIEDARMASAITELLMGSEVPPRRAFIYENAQEAELDI